MVPEATLTRHSPASLGHQEAGNWGWELNVQRKEGMEEQLWRGLRRGRFLQICWAESLSL